MGSTERTTEDAYNEVKGTQLILLNIVKFLSGEEALTVRLLGPNWDDIVPEVLRRLERAGKRDLIVDLKRPAVLGAFLSDFPAGSPPLALCEFANFYLNPSATRAEVVESFGGIHGTFLRFVTICMGGIPGFISAGMNPVKMLLHHCPFIEKLSIRKENCFEHNVNQTTHTELGMLPNLKELEIHHLWSPTFYDFLQVIMAKAPKLEGISMTIDLNPKTNQYLHSQGPQQLAPYLNIFKHLPFRKLELQHAPDSIFKELPEIDINISESLSMSILVGSGQFQEKEVKDFTDWLGRQVNLQSLSFSRFLDRLSNSGFPFELPPVTNIRELELNYIKCRVQAGQVPNLEKVNLKGYEGNPFDPEIEYPKMKSLRLSLAGRRAEEVFKLPNLETLQIEVKPTTMGLMKCYLGKFRTIVNLVVDFHPESSGKAQRNAWWNFFTGGIEPMMRKGTPVEYLRTRFLPIRDAGGLTRSVDPLPLQLIPNLKTLQLKNTPEIVTYGVIILTAIGMIPDLQFLGIELNWEVNQNEIRKFLGLLEEYHQRVTISGLPLPAYLLPTNLI